MANAIILRARSIDTLAKLIQFIFPLIALMLLIIGVKRNAISYVISSLWLSLIAILIHFQVIGDQIFGTYFNYTNAAIYSLNVIILLLSLIQIISHLSTRGNALKYTCSLVNAALVVGTLFVITNLWINAFLLKTNLKEPL